jgi:predicted glycoside hydrolase/deacetylase ChbG (UPF0249 family)
LPHRVVLCADDYGLTEGVSRGILALADLGRLSATSAMTNMPAWRSLAPALRERKGRVGVGLHLNLTTGAPLGVMPQLAPGGSFPPLGRILQRALAGRLASDEVRTEIERQLDAFEDGVGGPPAFVDGHQHVHVLPGVRRALIEALRARSVAGLWVRDPSDRFASILQRGLSAGKALTVAALSTGLSRDLRAAGFDANDGFSGFSPLEASTDPARVFGRAFVALGPRPVVMCHPGRVDGDLNSLDPAVESRERELAYMASDQFTALLDSNEVVLTVRP